MDISYNKWLEEYIPIENGYKKERNNNVTDYLFHIRGIEHLKVQSFPQNQVWILCLYENTVYIKAVEQPNPNICILGYCITISPWINVETYVVLRNID
jgi:hypothetical protein